MKRGADTAPRFAFFALLAWLAITLLWWALAFAPLEAPPEWIESARSVCFGSLPNGLPDTWGWISLASPLTMLGFLLAVWGKELLQSLRSLAGNRAGRGLLIVLVLIPLAGGIWVVRRIVAAREVDALASVAIAVAPLPVDYPQSTAPSPPIDLVDQHGSSVTLDAFAGKPILLTFAYAHCQTVCPVVVETVRSAAVELGDLSPPVVVVTLDPWRDTPGSLPGMVEGWRLGELPDVHLLSGEVADVVEVLAAWEVPYERNMSDGEIFHPALIHVLGPDGSRGYTFNGPSVDWVVEAARRLARDQPGA